MRLLPVLSLSALAVLGVGFAFHDPITIKRVPVVGVKVNFAMDGTLNVNGMDVTISGKGTEKVTAVDPNGTFTTESTQSDVMFNGSPIPVPDTPVKQVEKLDGEIVSLAAPEQGGGNPMRFQEIIQSYLPAAPLNVGDSFTLDVKSSAEGAIPLHVDGKLVGLEKVGAWDTAKLDEVVKETSGGADAASVHSTIWVDVTDGSPVKQTIDLTNVPLGPIVVSSGKLTTTRTGS
jgi:hypothetical protein